MNSRAQANRSTLADISVVVCAHNPRQDYLFRVLKALEGQTLPKDRWELLVVDNASNARLADTYDLSWHPRARYVREDSLGVTRARLRAITETSGELVIFVDDDNVLASGFLGEALAIHGQYPHLAVFGAGSLEPEFEVQPAPELRPLLPLLALRSIATVRWSNNARDYQSIPCGAGLCVSRVLATLYLQFVECLGLDVIDVLGRKGKELFSGEDDAFSWVAAFAGFGFGIFPQLRITHLISGFRLKRSYFLKLIHDHAFSLGVLHYMVAGIQPRRIDWVMRAHVLLHGLRNGQFSMRCHWAESTGEERAARLILEKGLQPIDIRNGLGDRVRGQ